MAAIIAPLFAALLLPTVLCESGSQSTPINYKHVTGHTPPCGSNSQENCLTHSPPANEHRRPCNPSDHCRGGHRLAGSESMSKAQVSAATKQFGSFFLPLGFAMDVVWGLFLFWSYLFFE